MASTDSSIITSLIEISRPMKRRKVLLLGAPEVGKSSILMRFKENIFLEIYEPTIQNSTKKFIPFRNEYVELEINDLDGQTEYTIFSQNKFSFGINGYLLVYSVNNRDSFELIKTIIEKLNALVGRKFPKIIIGNKSDCAEQREVTFNEGKEYASSINAPFIETSAKNNDNIEKAFHTLLIEINKIENNFDVNKLCCSSVFKCVVKNDKCMTVLFYFLLVMNLMMSVLSLYFGIETSMKSPGGGLPYHFVPLCVGLWSLILTCFGWFGLKNKKTDFIAFYIMALLFGSVALIGIIIGFFFLPETSKQEEEPFEEYIKQLRIFQKCSYIILLLNVLTVAFSMIYKKIYDLDLLSYII